MRESFLFGIILWISIWPMAMIIVYRSCTSWYLHGLATWLWVAIADLTYAIIAFSIGGILVNYLQNNAVIFRIISAIVLLWFGIYMLRKSIYMKETNNTKENKKSLIKDLISAYGLTIINPMTIVMFRWFSWQVISMSTTFVAIITLSLLLFLGSLSIQLSIALISGQIKNKIHNVNIVKYINIVASIGVIIFALKWLVWL